jgi:hypothetical protein
LFCYVIGTLCKLREFFVILVLYCVTNAGHTGQFLNDIVLWIINMPLKCFCRGKKTKRKRIKAPASDSSNDEESQVELSQKVRTAFILTVVLSCL